MLIEQTQELMRDVAHKYLLPRYKNLGQGDIDTKLGDDPVTIVDREVEAALSHALCRLILGANVLGEEAFFHRPELIRQFDDSDPIWIIDPLDGTRSFVEGRDDFGMIVALARGNQTVAAFLYNPLSDRFIVAERGGGAYFGSAKLHTLPAPSLPEMDGTFGYKITKPIEDRADQTALAAGPRYQTMGSACHDYARLAAPPGLMSPGRQGPQYHFRAVYNSCTPWDDAAGILIHQEAGGYTAHWDGTDFAPSDYGKGLLSAPDRASWADLRAWIARYCDVDGGEGAC